MRVERPDVRDKRGRHQHVAREQSLLLAKGFDRFRSGSGHIVNGLARERCAFLFRPCAASWFKG